jgi:predicted enzyme related to lactoylglutathione lyase
MTHPVMWFEVLGTDGGSLRKFYGDLFGWTFDVIPQIDYGVANTGDTRGIMGGIGPAYPGTKSWVTFYTETSDVTASLEKARGLGGRIIMPRTELPGAILGIFEDPEGHTLGLVEARKTAAQ